MELQFAIVQAAQRLNVRFQTQKTQVTQPKIWQALAENQLQPMTRKLVFFWQGKAPKRRNPSIPEKAHGTELQQNPGLERSGWDSAEEKLSTLRRWKYTDHPKELPTHMEVYRPWEVKWTTPSHQGVDGAVACRPPSTGWHVRVTKDSTNQRLGSVT